MLVDFSVKDFRHLFSGMLAVHKELQEKIKDDITSDIQQGLLSQIVRIEEICKTLNVDVSGCVERLKNKINNPQRFTASVESLWGEFRNRIFDELQKHSFMYIPEIEKGFYKQKTLFGKTVFDNFPSARKDIQEAGNCYATSNYNACVFYLMRAVEVGLKTTVRSMKAQKYTRFSYKN
jgi:hypothetical protein